MNTLHWPDEIRSTEELELPEDVKVSPAELKMAENLVGMMAMTFEPDEFKDEYKAPEPEAAKKTTAREKSARKKAS